LPISESAEISRIGFPVICKIASAFSFSMRASS